ncbi:tandem-95 repeat protein [Mariniflexile gromovii]|uniref:Tandem-95 repeat protein n=1 Tax=Mariniflexile gromovii TaxID=362523 RepID=A0ABS4BWW3_9FLAO|nr:tandem-95 repeat protein [Mariniflexile gromovii]MBP0905091.1 tandem-95 repeat protein [Mariniflexile gromovii]
MFKNTFKTLAKHHFFIASLVLLSLVFNSGYAHDLKIPTLNKTSLISTDFTGSIIKDDSPSSINSVSTSGNNFINNSELKITIDYKKDILCHGESTGKIKVSAMGGVAPYTYSINGSTPQSNSLFEGLPAGAYTIKLFDCLGKSTSICVTLHEPGPLRVTITKDDATTCQDCKNGKATATVVGGTPPYSYLWSASAGNQTTQTATNVPSGNHIVTVKDANNCVLSQEVVIGCSHTCDAIVKVENVIDVLCAGENLGSATVSASSATYASAKFTFTWNTSPVQVDSGVTTSTLSSLKAGIYTVSVTMDGTNCLPIQKCITISEPDSVLDVTATATDESGINTNDGTAIATTTGGTAPYTYLWSPGGQTTDKITGLSSGTYTVTATDAHGCTATTTVNVNPGNCNNLSLNPTTTAVSCNGGDNGTASANVTGGSGSFTYLWSPGGATTQSISGLSVGMYTVSITDTVTKCMVQATAMVNEPNALSSGIVISNVLCFGENTGSLDITVDGGTSPYEFLWSNGATTEDLNNLSAGTYSVTITDAEGCTTSNTATVRQPNSGLNVAILSQSNAVCNLALGSVIVNATGGTTPYNYTLKGATQSTGEFANLEAGDYTINVIDANGCEKSIAITIYKNCTNAENDINNTFVDTAVTGNVLTNDTDAEGDTQRVTTTTVTTVQGVVVTIDPATGAYTYTPPAGYIGEDSFEYTVCDNGTPEACDMATVYIEVLPRGGSGNRPPIANSDTAGTEMDTPVTGNVLSNDFDPDGDPIVVTTPTVTTVQGVVVTIDPATGAYTYTPPTGFVGEDRFDYTICDNGTPALCDTATVVITVWPNNGNTTIANDDVIYNNTCDSITGNVLDNDSDPEDDIQTVSTTPVSNVTNGVLSLNTNGSFTYTPNAGFIGADSFVYRVCDNGTPQACDQATVYITITDAEAPFIVNCNIEDRTMECNGLDNKTLAETWNSENIAALEICAEDICDMSLTGQVTSDFDFNNFQSSCGLSGSIDVTYTITDDSGSATTLSVTLTIVDTTPPDISNCILEDKSLSCTLTTAKENADQWNLDNIATLEACAKDACSVDQAVTITSNYNFDNLASGQLIVVYTVTDDCGNTSTTDAMLTLQNDAVSSTDISLCVASEVESQVFNLFNLLSGNYNTGGTWEVVSGNGTVIDDHFFNPKSIILNGENASETITFSYTETSSNCPTYIEASIDVNNICEVKGCDLDNIEISILLTPNGDSHNEYFTVKGVEDCEFKTDVKIINRWGAIIFQSSNYQNDWNAFTHKSSLGPAGQVTSGTYYYVVTLVNSGKAPITGLMYIGTK